MRVSQLINSGGRPVPNHFVIEYNGFKWLQSYNALVARIDVESEEVELDQNYWEYSKTTARHRNAFLGMDNSEVKRHVDDGTFRLVDLNALGVYG
jgi:hypothetical protein